MGMFDKDLKKIRGYQSRNGDSYYVFDTVYKGKAELINSLLTIVTAICASKYPDVDISEEVAKLPNLKWGPDIRNTIYMIFKKIAVGSGIYLGRELVAIRYAHFGRDMREPLYDALIKIGAEENLYYPTTGDDYIYTISNGVATLQLYKGEVHPFLAIPNYVNDGGSDIPVGVLSCLLFSNCDWLEAVYIPENVTKIE